MYRSMKLELHLENISNCYVWANILSMREMGLILFHLKLYLLIVCGLSAVCSKVVVYVIKVPALHTFNSNLMFKIRLS